MDVDLPEVGLIAAVLQTGIRDAVNRPKENDRPVRIRRHVESLEWIAADDALPFSFRWCCDVLDVDPDLTRHLIRTSPATVRRKLAHAKSKRG